MFVLPAAAVRLDVQERGAADVGRALRELEHSRTLRAMSCRDLWRARLALDGDQLLALRADTQAPRSVPCVEVAGTLAPRPRFHRQASAKMIAERAERSWRSSLDRAAAP